MGRKETYIFGRRQLVIADDSDISVKEKERVKIIIKLLFSSNEILLKFNFLKVILYEKFSPKDYRKIGHTLDISKQQLLSAEAEGEDSIKLNLGFLNFIFRDKSEYNLTQKRLYDELLTILVHEAVHLLHQKFSNIHIFIEKRRAQIKEMMDKEQTKINFNSKQELYLDNTFFLNNTYSVRLLVTQMLWKIYVEGIAVFFEELYVGNLNLDKDNFEVFYSNSKRHMQRAHNEFLANFRNLLKGEKISLISLNEIANVLSYDVGKHIIFSIKFLDPKISDEELLRLSIYTLIRKYEQLMLKAERKPVISLYSKTGIFDYKTVLATIQAIIKTKKK